MDFNKTVYSIQVKCEKTKNIYRIETVWDNNGFLLTILDGSLAFRVDVPESKLNQLANKYEIDVQEYIIQIKQSLCEKVTEKCAYYRQENKFLILRREGNITVQFADFALDKVDFNDAAIQFIDDMMISNEIFQNKILKHRELMGTIEKEKDIYAEKLETFVKKKKEMEHELYSKFILILNEKKTRIQYLTEMLEKYKNNTKHQQYEDSTEVENKIQYKKVETKRLEAISESDSDSSTEEPAEKFTHEVQIECHASSSKKKSDFFDDDDDINNDILPKRSKTSSNKDSINIDKQFNKEDKNKSCTDIKTVSNNFDAITENTNNDASQSQDSLNFNTQDLFDRL